MSTSSPGLRLQGIVGSLLVMSSFVGGGSDVPISAESKANDICKANDILSPNDR